jgi:hypothetical protein
MGAKWNFRVEAESLSHFYSWIKHPSRQARVRDNMHWAFAKARRYLRLHSGLLLVGIVLNASIPVLIAMAGCPILYTVTITLASFAAAVILAAAEGLHVRQMWKYYREALEFAKRECSLAESRIDHYQDLSQEETERQLIGNCERYLVEHALPGWRTINKDHS